MDEDTELKTDESTVRIDLLVDQVTMLVERMDAVLKHEGNTNTTTVIHKTEGMSAWSVAAVVACFSTIAMLILFAIVVIPELHDAKAWIDISRGQIAKIQAHIEMQKAREK